MQESLSQEQWWSQCVDHELSRRIFLASNKLFKGELLVLRNYLLVNRLSELLSTGVAWIFSVINDWPKPSSCLSAALVKELLVLIFSSRPSISFAQESLTSIGLSYYGVIFLLFLLIIFASRINRRLWGPKDLPWVHNASAILWRLKEFCSLQSVFWACFLHERFDFRSSSIRTIASWLGQQGLSYTTVLFSEKAICLEF